MCAFYTYHIFDHPRLQNVTYYLRLDTDSYILEPICYDPIERFHSRNLSYAFISARTDPRWVTDGLWELVDDYARNTTGMEERMEKNGWEWPKGRYMPEMKEEEFPMFYNNFEVVRLERFRQYDIQAWLKEVASVPKRFYKYRWGSYSSLLRLYLRPLTTRSFFRLGDAPLRTATVYMFLNVTTEAEQFCGIRYDHNGVQEPQCECVP
jgi:mannosyltransferase